MASVSVLICAVCDLIASVSVFICSVSALSPSTSVLIDSASSLASSALSASAFTLATNCSNCDGVTGAVSLPLIGTSAVILKATQGKDVSLSTSVLFSTILPTRFTFTVVTLVITSGGMSA